MKLLKWSKKYKNHADDEQLFVRLNTDNDGDIHLVLCDKNGKRVVSGTILYLDLNHKMVIICDGLTDLSTLKTDFLDHALAINEMDVKIVQKILKSEQSAKHLLTITRGAK